MWVFGLIVCLIAEILLFLVCGLFVAEIILTWKESSRIGKLLNVIRLIAWTLMTIYMTMMNVTVWGS